MSYRTTAVLFVIAVALTIYIYTFETEVIAGMDRPGRIFVGLEPTDISSFEIEYLGDDASKRVSTSFGNEATKIRVERRKEVLWELVAPLSFPGFVPRIQGLTWAFADLVQVAKVDPESEAAKTAVPESGSRQVLRFETRQGKKHEIEIGRDYPVSTMPFIYVRVDGATYAVKKEFAESFRVGFDDLRSRALFPISAVDASELAVRGSGFGEKRWSRAKESDPWLFDSKDEWGGTLADRKQMKLQIDALNSWQIRRFERDGPAELTAAELKKFGLQEPRFVVEAAHRNGGSVSLEVGDDVPGEKGRLFIRRSGKPSVFVADAEPLATLRQTAEEFRTRNVFDFEGAEARRVVCRGPGVPGFELFLKKRPKRPGQKAEPVEDWYVKSLADGSVPELADPKLVRIAIGGLREMLVQKFLKPLAAKPSDDEVVTVSVELDTGETRRLLIGKRSEDPRHEAFAFYHATRSTDRSHFLAETHWPDRAQLGDYVFRNRAISSLVPSRVYQLAIRSGTKEWELYRLPKEGWSLSADVELAEGLTFDPKLVDELLSSLAHDRFRVRSFEP
ncbi:MAG: DUF4340 domain-containing protein, partial [Planctomycetota bacterium]